MAWSKTQQQGREVKAKGVFVQQEDEKALATSAKKDPGEDDYSSHVILLLRQKPDICGRNNCGAILK